MSKTAFLKNKNKVNFQENCKIIVPISVGQHYHEMEEFQATIEFLKKEFSGSVTFLIADTLQRFTKALSSCNNDPNSFFKETKEDGEKWLSRNEEYIYGLNKKSFQVFLWEYYLNNGKYEEKKFFVDELYKHDEVFKKTVDDTAKGFIRRHFKLQEIYNAGSLEAVYSREYVLEECAVLLLWSEEEYNFILYPNKLNQSMYNLLQRFVHRENPNLLQPIEINFKETNLSLKSNSHLFLNSFIENQNDKEKANYLLLSVEKYINDSSISYASRKNFIFSLSATLGEGRRLLHQQKEIEQEETHRKNNKK